MAPDLVLLVNSHLCTKLRQAKLIILEAHNCKHFATNHSRIILASFNKEILLIQYLYCVKFGFLFLLIVYILTNILAISEYY